MFGKEFKKAYMESQVALQKALNMVSMYKSDGSTCDSKMYNVMLKAKDMILCSNRFEWKNLPINLTSSQLESMLYEYGSLCAFVENGTLIFSRYTVKDCLTVYGRLEEIQPIDFKGKAYGGRKGVISRNGANTRYGDRVAVIISDYTFDYSQEPISRAAINSATTIADQVNVYMQLDNNIKLSVKKALALCDNEEQKNVVINELNALLNPNTPVVPITTGSKNGTNVGLPVEMFNFNNNFDCQNYCQTADYFDKVRRSFNGIPAPDTFEKKERKVVGETEDTTTHTNIVLRDGLKCRQDALELIKEYLDFEDKESVSVDLVEELKEKEVEPNESSDNNDAEDDISDKD